MTDLLDEVKDRYHSGCGACSEIPADAETLSDVVDEYLHWRKVNPHIKGGENYLKRLRSATREPVASGDKLSPVADNWAGWYKWLSRSKGEKP
jgi:hypothetical protein